MPSAFTGAGAAVASCMTQGTTFPFCSCQAQDRNVKWLVKVELMQRKDDAATYKNFGLGKPGFTFQFSHKLLYRLLSLSVICHMGFRQPFLTGCDAGVQTHCRQQCCLGTLEEGLGRQPGQRCALLHRCAAVTPTFGCLWTVVVSQRGTRNKTEVPVGSLAPRVCQPGGRHALKRGKECYFPFSNWVS